MTNTGPQIETFSCACGKLTAVALPGVTLTKLRCPWCPPKDPRPKLRVV